jgi:hypothetical protein
MKKLLHENKDFDFLEDGNIDKEQLILCIFLIYEWSKGKDSEWFLFIDSLPEVQFFCEWDESIINATQNETLVMCATSYKFCLDEEWTQLMCIFMKYPDVFKFDLTYEMFTRFYAQVCTRCFGWHLPCTTMAPFADNINH